MRIIPDLSIATEETDEGRRENSHYECVIDPLDGTIPFQGDLPLYGVTFALRDNKKHETVAAAFCGPELCGESESNVVLSATKGKGAFLNGKKFKPVFVTKPLKNVIFTTDRGKYNRQDIIRLEEALMKKDGIRYQMIFGSSSASLARVLLGKEDGYISLTADPWDIEALAFICKQAGGLTVRNRSNQDWKPGDASILAMPVFLRSIFDKKYQRILDKTA